MKLYYLFFLLCFFGCVENNKHANANEWQVDTGDSVIVAASDTVVQIIEPPSDTESPEIISNERFRNVNITNTDTTFIVAGQARVFEATIDWVIEDRQQVIKKGYVNADRGAPEWGNFKLTISLQKPSANSSVKLILFEASANDGSRQYEVPLTLY